MHGFFLLFFFSSRRRHTRWNCDWSSDVCSSDLDAPIRIHRIIQNPRRQVAEERSWHVAHQVGARRAGDRRHDQTRSEERRVGKSVDLGGRRIIEKKKKNKSKESTMMKKDQR